MIRSLFFSDSHLRRVGASVKQTMGVVIVHDSYSIFMVGDLVDVWVDPDAANSKEVRTFKAFLLKLAAAGKDIVWAIGNHDAEFLGQDDEFPGVFMTREAYYKTTSGKRYLVCHGDRFDKWMQYRSFGIVCARLYNWVRHRRWSLAEHLMNAAENSAGTDLDAFEKAACRYARRRGCDGIICGHTHVADYGDRHGMEYWNCGEAADNCIIEQDGELMVVESPAS